MRERALRELGLAPAWVQRRASSGADEPAARANPATPMVQAVELRLGALQVETLDLIALHAAIEMCQACPRALQRSAAMPGQGPPSARLMVIDLVPEPPQAGASASAAIDAARLFDQLLFALGVKREAIFLSHALRCDGSRPSAAETSRCAPYLQREVALLAPRAVLVMGQAAAEAVASLDLGSCRVFSISHPSQLVSDATGKRRAWTTLRELRAWLATP